MHVTCPNCKKDIDLVGPEEIASEYGLTPNQAQAARDSGALPEPWLDRGARGKFYLRGDFEKYLSAYLRDAAPSVVRHAISRVTDEAQRERLMEMAVESFRRELEQGVPAAKQRK